jgi:hypothetical protein
MTPSILHQIHLSKQKASWVFWYSERSEDQILRSRHDGTNLSLSKKDLKEDRISYYKTVYYPKSTQDVSIAAQSLGF